ncbi:ester cyclase [Streptomyces sp. NPDC004457]|uniref:ester cyclase n=1 Tax=Streptomyces spinosus TaxID=2872623 RepID=UPI001CEC3A22|nr:ester cyclase [Streptomyces spinosus]
MSRKLTRAAVAAAVAASVAAGTALAAGPSVAEDRQPAGSHAWPWKLVDGSPGLVRPTALTVDRSIGEHRAALEVRLAQQLYTFWNTGEKKYLDASVSPDFVDNTLPPGRPQGPEGPLSASRNFRAAVPDLTCELADLLITGDKITARLVFRGHFTGTFDGVRGKGQEVDFNAIDIQHVGERRIVEDWHIEDNQTLLSQLGAD